MEIPQVVVRVANKKDIQPIADNMRWADKNEVYLANHLTPREAVERSFNNSALYFTIEINKRPEAMFGVVNIDDGVGCIWMLSTDKFCKISKLFLKHCKAHVELILKHYDKLYNYVYAENRAAIRWIKKCGAVFHVAAPYGVENRMFRYFEFRGIDADS
jgi:hypothetical protein